MIRQLNARISRIEKRMPLKDDGTFTGRSLPLSVAAQSRLLRGPFRRTWRLDISFLHPHVRGGRRGKGPTGADSMKAIVRRLKRLEQSCTPVAHVRCQRAAEVLWERRQSHLKAEGLPFETIMPPYSQGPYMSCAETLRMCRRERVARQRGEREAADGA
jgi:hypothetical protein